MANKKIEKGKVEASIKLRRLIWIITSVFLFHPFSTFFFRLWRIFLLNMFGAKISYKANVYASVKIWAPWNLRMEAGSCLGPNVICYNQADVILEEDACVSQYSYLCTAGHKSEQLLNAQNGLVIGDITIHNNAWVGSRAFIGLGVEVGEGAIVGATASVYKDVEPWTVVGGNPARFIKKRVLI